VHRLRRKCRNAGRQTHTVEIDAQGINVCDFEDLLCHKCRNAPLIYYCPVCDFKVCTDCLHKCFTRLHNGALECHNCANVDKKLTTYVGPGKV